MDFIEVTDMSRGHTYKWSCNEWFDSKQGARKEWTVERAVAGEKQPLTLVEAPGGAPRPRTTLRPDAEPLHARALHAGREPRTGSSEVAVQSAGASKRVLNACPPVAARAQVRRRRRPGTPTWQATSTGWCSGRRTRWAPAPTPRCGWS